MTRLAETWVEAERAQPSRLYLLPSVGFPVALKGYEHIGRRPGGMTDCTVFLVVFVDAQGKEYKCDGSVPCVIFTPQL